MSSPSSWRWIFWINVPVGLLAVGAVLRFAANSRGTRRPIDPLALLLAIVSVLGIVWAVIRAATTGWGDRAVVGALAIGLTALCALLAWQRRAPQPMIPLRLFRNGVFCAGNAAIFAQNASLTAASPLPCAGRPADPRRRRPHTGPPRADQGGGRLGRTR